MPCEKCAYCGPYGCGIRRIHFKSGPRSFRILSGMWRGDDVFYYANSRWIVVSDRVKRLLEELGATNVSLSPM